MEKHFGFGEYERIDVDVRTSTWYFRYNFLQTLLDKKGFWAKSLLRIANYDFLPKQLLEPKDINKTIGVLLPFLFNKNPFDFELTSEFFDTPFYHYCSYFFDKTEEIEELVRELEKTSSNLTNFHTNKIVLQKILPDWNTLKAKEDGYNLRYSLEMWAKSYNLYEDWCLDYALYVFSNLKTYLDVRFRNVEFQDLTIEKLESQAFWVDYESRDSLRNGLSDLHSEIVYAKLFDFDEAIEETPFIFKKGDFEMPETTWFPRTSRRKAFVDEQITAYNRWIEEIKYIDQLPELPSESYRNRLNNYCNDVETLISQPHNKASIRPFSLAMDNWMFNYYAVWRPSQESRESFIENTLNQLNDKFCSAKQMAQSLGLLGKDEYELALWNYCNRVEKKMPKNYAKTPTKYKQSHFEWLADFQVSPCKNYEEIAEGIERMNRPTIDAVKKGISRLAKYIGISPRKVPRTGRPKGIIETHKRHRVKKIEFGTF